MWGGETFGLFEHWHGQWSNCAISGRQTSSCSIQQFAGWYLLHHPRWNKTTCSTVNWDKHRSDSSMKPQASSMLLESHLKIRCVSIHSFSPWGFYWINPWWAMFQQFHPPNKFHWAGDATTTTTTTTTKTTTTRTITTATTATSTLKAYVV